MIDTVIITLVQIAILLAGLLTAVAYLVLLERKVQAWVQVRLGPMRVGYHGILQPVADILKLVIKEDITPARADKWIYTLSPILVLVPALIVFAVIPFGTSVTLFGVTIPLYISDLNVGLLYITAVASLGVYGLILGGWSSNSKYPLLASLRASAQLISYEVAVTMTLVSMILMAGTLSMVGIVEAQRTFRLPFLGSTGLWFIFAQPVAFFIYFVGGLAETNRAPFDLPEAEQELVGGFHTEYSGMRFALFFLAEYANMIVISTVATTLFLGGWLRPFPNVAWLGFLDWVPGWAWFIVKTFAFLWVFLWVRATLPRYRYDQLMRLGWKFLIPLAIANVMITAALVVLL
jgi:NADH-quinone oxidoreductase subunit H